MRMPAQRAPWVVPGSATWRMSAIILSSLSVTALKDTSLTRSRISRAPRAAQGARVIYRNEDRVPRRAFTDQRRNGGIPGKIPVPISLTVDLDGLEERRQTSGGQEANEKHRARPGHDRSWQSVSWQSHPPNLPGFRPGSSEQ